MSFIRNYSWLDCIVECFTVGYLGLLTDLLPCIIDITVGVNGSGIDGGKGFCGFGVYMRRANYRGWFLV